MEKRRVRKGIVKKSIKAIWIIIFILLIIGAFLFSEKVHKIDMIDNIKNRLLGQVEDEIDSSNKIIDIDVIENNDLHLEEESNISEFAQENSTASYAVKPIPNFEAQDIFYDDESEPRCYLYVGTYPLNPVYSYTNPSETLILNVGEETFTQLLYTKKAICYCGNILVELAPEWMAVDPKRKITNSNPNVIKNEDITWSLVPYDPKVDDDIKYEGWHSLKIGFKSLRPGECLLEFSTYQNYYYYYTWQQCRRCGQKYKEISFKGKWIEEKETINVIVNANYKLEYKEAYYENNIPKNEEKSVAETTCEFEISSAQPEQEGYIFKGWSTKQNADEGEYFPGDKVTLEWKEGFGSQDNPVTLTLYPVWEENGFSTYTVIYTDGVKGEIVFPDKCTEDLREGESTPSFGRDIDDEKYEIIIVNGKEVIIPLREGYKFVDWSPTVKPYVSSNDVNSGYNTIVYTAMWKKEGSEEPTKPSKLYTITVKNEKAGHTYNSYQVFAGEFAYDKENQPILSNIVWSEEFQKIAENEKTYGDKLIEKLKDPNENTYASLFTDCQTALDIAEILAGKEDDGAEIREFTKVTGKFILENNIKITKGVSDQTTETIAGEEVKSYKIIELESGYYIVIDAKANTEDDAYSRYLIDVVQDVTMEPKSSIPTLSKKVTTNNIEGSEKVNTASHIENGEYDIGFEIVTTIGTDMDAYGSEYKYDVVDILDKGVEYDRESVKIYVGENKIECGKESYTLSDILITEENYNTYKEYFEEGEPSEQYGKKVVLIDFKDIPGKVSRGELLEGQKITINYNAKLNKNCEVGKVANVNKAYLKYSNNPYQINNTAKTKTVTTLTYTISLNIEKIGEIKTEDIEKKYLSGAIFEIYDEPEYNEGRLIPEKNQNRKLIGTVEIGEEGKAKYNSLGAGTYYIKESKAPDGYNMLKEEIEMKVIATYDGFDINWEVEDKSNSKLVLIEKEIAEGTNINLEIQNTRGVQLPVTGGTGTLIFTVVGIGIMGLAVIGLKK